MEISLKIGHCKETAVIPDTCRTTILKPKDLPQNPDEQSILDHAFQNPVGSKKLSDIVKPHESVAVITSDISRPCPSWRILPSLVKELEKAGVSDSDITIYFALGSHRHSTDAEKEHLAGTEIFHRIRCTDSNPDDTVTLGTTKRGTIVQIDRRIVNSDRVICIGNVEYHYFAGFSGGAKAIFPGVSTPASIAMNHRMMSDPCACTGKLKGNPVREDIEEAASMLGCDFIVNVVLNTDKQIASAYCGDMIQAHRKACAYLDHYYRCPIDKKADIVLVSQGGAPKDLNLYQLQKALDNAKYAVRDGGTIILTGSAEEGFGNKTFEEWMLGYHSAEEMVQALHAHFVLGGHKACAIAQVTEHADVMLVSDMDPLLVSKTLLKPVESLQSAVNQAVEKYGSDSDVIVMPYGGSTLPECR